MGSRGRIPDKHSTETARGRNSLARRLPLDITATMPKCPPDLPEAAKKFWKAHARSLFERGYRTPSDVPAFSRLCSTWHQLLELDQILQSDGLTATSSTGVVRANPAAAMRTSCEKTFLSLAIQFGMSPNSRQRVPPAETPKPTTRMRRDRNAGTIPVEQMSDDEKADYLEDRYFGD